MKTCALNLAEATSDTRVRTLMVDDSPFMLKILAQILQEAGNFDLVGTASDGSQALRYVSMLSPELVLMDVHMPHLNGIQATRYIKQREDPPIIILVTSDDSAVTKTTAEEAGADAFVSKEGDLRQQMMGALQNLFGPNGVRRAKSRNTVSPNRHLPNKTSENGLGNFATQERFDSALGKFVIQAANPGKDTEPCKTPTLGSAQRPQARCAQSIQHTVDRSSASLSLARAKNSRNCALPYESRPLKLKHERTRTNTSTT